MNNAYNRLHKMFDSLGLKPDYNQIYDLVDQYEAYEASLKSGNYRGEERPHMQIVVRRNDMSNLKHTPQCYVEFRYRTHDVVLCNGRHIRVETPRFGDDPGLSMYINDDGDWMPF